MLFPLFLKIGLYAAVLIAALLLLDQLFLWFERRGWMYWRKKKRSESKGSRGPLSAFQEFVQPEIRHVQQDREQRHAVSEETDPSGR
jgi:hypothetical protein